MMLLFIELAFLINVILDLRPCNFRIDYQNYQWNYNARSNAFKWSAFCFMSSWSIPVWMLLHCWHANTEISLMAIASLVMLWDWFSYLCLLG